MNRLDVLRSRVMTPRRKDEDTVHLDDCCSLLDFATLIGVPPVQLRVWKHRSKTVFPDPVLTISGRDLYDCRQLAEWLLVEKNLDATDLV